MVLSTFDRLLLTMPSDLKMTDEQFWEFCQINRHLRIEGTKTGEVIIMSPTGSETGNRNGDIFGQLWLWSKKDKKGLCFDSSTGFTLSSGATVSPDVSWIKLERWQA